MAKRYGKTFENYNSTPTKRAKLDISVSRCNQTIKEKRPASSSKNLAESDLWGDDFNDADIEEMDLMASQVVAESQVSIIETDLQEIKKPIDPVRKYQKNSDPRPSTSYGNSNHGSSHLKSFQPKTTASSQSVKHVQDLQQRANHAFSNHGSIASQYKHQPSQKISSSERIKEIHKDEHSILFDDFQNNLLESNNPINSTFQSQKPHTNGTLSRVAKSVRSNGMKGNEIGESEINVSDDSILRQLEKLKLENQKLLNNFITKEGETAFLRNQLQQTQHRAENDKMEKARLIEEQANQFRSEINVALREKDSLKTQLELQTLQLSNLRERYKLLDTGSIKLVQPHTAQLDSGNRNRLNTTLGRSSSVVKTIQVTETGVQTADIDDRQMYRLKTTMEKYPFSKIPQSIFEGSCSEPSVVEIQIVEKVGKRNLPILQDEENFRIFENPDLVKPIVTMVGKQRLSVEFCLTDIAILMKRNAIECNNHDMFPFINKLVATARELLLNTTQVLHKISQVMKNDDIRDMNDLYFSDFYKIHVDSTRSFCDSKAWYDKERGIEARRSLAILSYISPTSNYLSEYIVGMTPLRTSNDAHYENYIQEMSSYNKWSKKGSEYEMLELLLEFVTTVGLVRRSHQFSGLIIAVMRLLITVERKIANSEKGITYISKIFREIIFARPLLICYTFITKFMMKYSQCIKFVQQLCIGSSQDTITVWKDVLHFTPDACVMQIYIAQLEFFQPDPIITISIAYGLVCLVLNILSMDNLPWVTEPPYRCQCAMKLFELTTNFLYKCSKVNLDVIGNTFSAEYGTTSSKEPNSEYRLSSETSQTVHPSTSTVDLKTTFSLKRLTKEDRTRMKRKQLNTIRKGIIFLSNLPTRNPGFIMRSSEIEDSFNLFIQEIESFDDLELNENEKIALTFVKSFFIFERSTTSNEPSEKGQRLPGFQKHFTTNDKTIQTDNIQIREMIAKNVIPQNNKFSWLSTLLDDTKPNGS